MEQTTGANHTVKWRKCGHIYAPSGHLGWARQYALLPTALALDDKTIRIYYASLDDCRFGRIGFVDVDATHQMRVLFESPNSVLDVGPLGAFDDCGVNPSCVVRTGSDTRLYYIGWQRCQRVPYMLFSGLAIAGERAFNRYSSTPILDRTPAEPYSRSAPFVMWDDGVWRMYYWSCVEWSGAEKGVHYNNVIRTTVSEDGVQWSRETHVCVRPDFVDEYSLGRPWVIKEGGIYRMWYSIRSFSKLYTIGYAESPDGTTWQRRDDEAGIAASPAGWDSEMICYPCVVDAAGSRYMFYNGNRHGATGFGYAILES